MPKFKVKEGSHVEGDGKVYTKGDVFDSPHNLDKVFDQKFERIGGPALVQGSKVVVDGARSGTVDADNSKSSTTLADAPKTAEGEWEETPAKTEEVKIPAKGKAK